MAEESVVQETEQDDPLDQLRDEDCTITVRRVVDGRRVWCGQVGSFEISEEAIFERWGGGTFSLQQRMGGKFGKSATIRIEGAPKVPSAPAAPAAPVSAAAPVAVPADSAMLQMFLQGQQQLQTAQTRMIEILVAQRAQPAETWTVDKILSVVTLAKELGIIGPKTAGMGVKDLLEIFTQLDELRARGGGEGGGGAAALLSLIPEGLKELRAIAELQARNAPPPPPAPAVAQLPPAAPEAQPSGEEVNQLQLYNRLRALMPRLVKAAHADADPAAYVVTLEIDEPDFIEAVRAQLAQQEIETVLELMVQQFPDTDPVQDWFAEFLEGLGGHYTPPPEEPAPAPAPAPAKKPAKKKGAKK